MGSRPTAVLAVGLASMMVTVVAAVAPAHAAFPGVNGKIAFSSDRDDPNPSCSFPDCNFEIYSMNADGSGVTRLTNDPARDLSPAWSADGTRIAFASSRASATGIYVMNADGSGVTQLSLFGATPSWSPDGTEIAYSQGSILARPAGGGPPRTIIEGTCDGATVPCYDYQAPAWSPDGRLIATTKRVETETEATFRIAIVRADGSGEVTTFPSFSSNPDWSPSGAQLAFSAGPATTGDRADIWRANPDGSGMTPVTNTREFENFAAWSPDGSRISFARGPGGNSLALNIYSADPSGAGEVQLTNTLGQNTMPDWQPLPGPKRADFKNAAQFCKAERDLLDDSAFRQKYGGGANAFGKCVSGK